MGTGTFGYEEIILVVTAYIKLFLIMVMMTSDAFDGV
jgi:hypothetical protein